MNSVKKLQNVRGTKDLFGDEILNFNHIIKIAQDCAQNYGFSELQTPIFEFSEVFERNLGQDSDILTKEVYKFPDRGDNYLTLRPEFTAAIIRSFINHGQLNQILPQKFFSYGPVFRYDRPQKGRQRQFHQINFEIIGSDDIFMDIEAILLAQQILEKIGLKDKITLQINTLGSEQIKAKYEKSLQEYFHKFKNDLSQDSQNRLAENPLRILDSKDKNDHKIAKDAPQITQFYDKKTTTDFAKILEKLHEFDINFQVNQKLVRGLDYYSSTVFEFVTDDLGAQNTVLAGGRYDNLIKKMGGNDLPAIGFAAGIERLMLLSNLEAKKPRPISIIYVALEQFDYAFNLAQKLRNKGFYIDITLNANMKKQWKKSDQNNAKAAVIIGQEEIEKGILKVKDLDSGQEKEVNYHEISSIIAK